MNKKVLVINLGWEQEPLLDLLMTKDVEIYGIHYDEQYYKEPNYKDVLITDLRDLSSCLEYANQILPDAVISDQCDYSQFVQAMIAEKFKLLGPSLNQAQISGNKYLQRRKAKKANITVPEFQFCVNINDVHAFVKKVGFPIILKPLDNRGSYGVNKVIDYNEIESAFFEALINSHSRTILAEKFIQGQEVTIDGYCFPQIGCRSLALATKKHLPERPVAVDILYPGELDSTVSKQLLKYNEWVNEQLGFQFGMIHTEYLITEDNKFYLVESANRGGGVYTSEIIVPHVCGIDILEQYVADCLGEQRKMFTRDIEENQTILYFFSFAPGKIKRIKGIDKVIQNTEVLKFRLGVQVGDTITPITADGNRHGFFILKYQGNIRDKAQEIINTLNIEYE